MNYLANCEGDSNVYQANMEAMKATLWTPSTHIIILTQQISARKLCGWELEMVYTPGPPFTNMDKWSHAQ